MTTERLTFDAHAAPTVFEKTVKEGEEPLEADVKQEKLIEGRVVMRNPRKRRKNPHSPSTLVESTPRTAMNDGTEAIHGKVTVNASAGRGDTSRNPEPEFPLGARVKVSRAARHGEASTNARKGDTGTVVGSAMLLVPGSLTARVWWHRIRVDRTGKMARVAEDRLTKLNPVMPWGTRTGKKHPGEGAGYSGRTLGENASAGMGDTSRNPHALIRSTKAKPGSSAGYSGVRPTKQTSYKAKDTGTFGQQHILEGEVPIEPGLRNPHKREIWAISDSDLKIIQKGLKGTRLTAKRSEFFLSHNDIELWRGRGRAGGINLDQERATWSAYVDSPAKGRMPYPPTSSLDTLLAGIRTNSPVYRASDYPADKNPKRNPHSEDMAKGTCPYCGVSNLVSSHETALNCGGCGQSLKVGGR